MRPDFEKWQQTADEIRHLAIEAEHLRSRERFQALYMIGSGQTNASEWAATIDRQKQTVLGWVHQYNEKGAGSLHYRASGGRQAKLSEVEKKDHRHGRTKAISGASDTGLRLDVDKITVLGRRKTTAPSQPHDFKNTLETSRFQLEKKKSKKVLGKAKPAQRAEFVERFQTWFTQVSQGPARLIYLDEAHLHQDVATGYRWSPAGEADVRTAGPHHEYVLTPVEGALPIPEAVDFDQAAFAYLPTLVLHALRLCDYRLGEHVCVIGQGVVGLMGSALAAALGILLITLDTDEARLPIARQMGIRHALNPRAPTFTDALATSVGDKGIDVTVDASGSYHGLVQAMALTRKSGRVVILGIYRPDPPDAAMAAQIHQAYLKNFHSKELRLVGCSNDPAERYPAHIERFTIHDNTRQSLDLLGQGKPNLAPAITHRFAPKDGPTLYHRLGQREAGILGALYDWH